MKNFWTRAIGIANLLFFFFSWADFLETAEAKLPPRTQKQVSRSIAGSSNSSQVQSSMKSSSSSSKSIKSSSHTARGPAQLDSPTSGSTMSSSSSSSTSLGSSGSLDEGSSALSDKENNEQVDQIEAEIERGGGAQAKASQRAPRLPSQPKDRLDPNLHIESISDLKRLSPFEEVSVLQRRYMPKTFRLQFFGGFSWLTNDPWFWGGGFSPRLGFNFRESLGFEVVGFVMNSSEKDTINDLYNQLGIRTSSITRLNNFVGLDFVWNPLYGKMSLLNNRIVPFDMYFSLGFGSSQIKSSYSTGTGDTQKFIYTSTTVPTYHMGTGQLFALTKSLGFRWDLSLAYLKISNPETGATTSYEHILLTTGVSYFIPKVKYR